MNRKIKFSHYYNKLEMPCLINEENKAVLLDVLLVGELSPPLVEYDTAYTDPETRETKHYPLPKGGRLMLIFQSCANGNIFTTIRSAKPGKMDYYMEHVGEEFDIVWVNESGEERDVWKR